MREYIYKHIKYITFAIALVIAIVLFNMHINPNTLFIKTLGSLNNIVYYDGELSIDVSTPSYYNGETLLDADKNYVNRVNNIHFGLDTTVTNIDDLEYTIVYDNTNNDSTYTPDVDYPSVELRSAKNLDISNIQTIDNPGIATNANKFDVITSGNKITIVDKGLEDYVGCGREYANKCVGFLVDLGVKVQGTGSYNIDAIDYTDAARWGATNDTTFVMWINPEKEGPFTFANVNNSEDTYELDIHFTNNSVVSVSKLNVENNNNPSEQDIVYNTDKFDVINDGNKVIITDKGLKGYVGGPYTEPRKWVGILVDFGVKVQGTGSYNIDEVDYTDAARWGATNNTTFVMWLTPEKEGPFTFVNENDSEDTYELDIQFNKSKIISVNKLNVQNNINPLEQDIVYNTGKFELSNNENNIVITDKGLEGYVGGPYTEPRKWVGILVDFGVKVQGTGSYNIDEVDYTDAARWGATNNTTFVMWLTPEKEGPFTFVNQDDSSDTYELNIRFDYYKKHVYLNNEINITNKFNTTIDLENENIVVSYKNGQDYIPGNYKLYVWSKSNETVNDNQTFELIDGYGFDMDSTSILSAGAGLNRADDNKWKITLRNVQNVDLNDITLDRVYKEEDDIKLDFTDYFSIDSVIVDSEDNTKAYIIIKSVPIISDIYLEGGYYNLEFSYLDLNKESTIDVGNSTYTISDMNSSSNRLVSSTVYYELINYNQTDNEVTIKINNENKTMSVADFNISYTGVDLSNIITDEDGNILYQYSNGLLVKSVTTEDEVEYVNYYDSNNELQQITMSEFNNNYGYLDVNNYVFTDNKIYKKVNGRYREFDNQSRTIRYADGGKFTFTYDYSDATMEDLSHMSIKLKHLTDDINSPEEFMIFDYGYTKERVLSDGEYKKVTGYTYTAYENSVDGPANRSFDITYELDTDRNVITFTIVYDNKLSRYAGDYDFTLSIFDCYEKTTRFTIDDSLVDFYVATYVDKHNGSGDSLIERYPPSNKQYEYYISLRMIKGNIDPDRHFDRSELSARIFSKLADLDNENNIYFYDQEDYVIKLLKYKDNVVTYKYSTDVDKADNEREYTEVTEELDGTSNLETKYTDVYNLLNKYNYDEEGNIVTDSDNYDKSIIHRTRVNNVEYLTFINNNEEVTTEANKYVSVGGNVNTLTDSFRYLEYDNNGDVIRGNIKGSYKKNTYAYSNDYDVTSLFDITINEDETDIDHAIKVLPKTEVPSGNYYVYVDYNTVLYGVGYVNNISTNKGIYESMDDVVIRPEIYPSLWNRNTHMSYLTYDNPEYIITITEGVNSNDVDDSDKIYYNAISHIMYRLTPSYIFDYADITYKLQKQVNDSYVDVNTDDYTIRLLSNDEEPIENISNYNGSYYVVVDTTADYESGNYRLLIEYTNPNNGISLNDDTYVDISLTNKYYGFNIAEGTDILEFPHNYERTKKVILEGINITDFDDIGINVYYYYDGQKYLLTKNDNEYSYTVDEDTNVYFTIDSEVKNNKYEVSITNNVNVTQIGNYIIEFSYQDGNNPVSTKSLDMYITQDQYQMEYENEYPRAAANELSFAKDFTTNYIDRSSLSNIKYVVYKLNTTTNEYVDVSSNDIQYVDRHVTSYSYEDISCEGVTCTGKIRFYLNKNKIDYNGTYKIVVTYSGIINELPITKFSTMYAWDIASTTITSVREYEEDGEDKTETVTGIYKDLTEPTITVTLDSTIHTNDVSWNVNTSCLSTSSGTCDPTNSAFSDFFAAVNTTGNDQKIVLTPTTDNNGVIRIQPGRYALVLYYDRNDYKVIEFEIHNQYNNVEYNITCEYGEATIKSSLTTYSGVEIIDGLYTNMSGELSIPVSITGIGYDSVSRYVINSSNNVVNQFEFNSTSDFVTNHITKITYNPSRGVVPTGDYKLITEYITPDNETIKVEYAFTMNQEWFDFNITDSLSVPTTLYDNRNGSAIFTIQTKNLNYLDKDEFNNPNNGRMHTFKNNTKVYNSSDEDVTNLFTLSVRAHDNINTTNKFDILVNYNANTLEVDTYRFVTTYTIKNRTIEKESTFEVVEGPDVIPPIESETYDVNNNIVFVDELPVGPITKEEFISKLSNVYEGYRILDKDNNDITDTVVNMATGMKIVNPDDGTYVISIIGDVNGDGKVSALDYVQIKNHIMDVSYITGDVYLLAANVYKDNKISALDYVQIKNYIMNGGQ